MFNLDPGKLLIVAVVAIVLLGPDKLPQAARTLGATWNSFNEFRHRMETEARSAIPDLPSTGDLARYVRSPMTLLDHLGPDVGAEDDAATAVGHGEPAVGDPGRSGPGHSGPEAALATPMLAAPIHRVPDAALAGDATLN